MKSATVPSNEGERLEALRRYEVLDTSREERFDRLTRLAASRLEVPISLISFIDASRQWAKSAVGLDSFETPRENAFCAHTILGDGPLIVEDALEDERFRDNPLVSGPPNIRFYAGIPLTTERGQALGTLCAIDHDPRRLSGDEQQFLRDIAAVVVDEMELLRTRRELEKQTAGLGTFVQALAHDVAGPLRRVRGFCDLIGEEPDNIDPEYLEHIQSSVQTAQALLRDLRALYTFDPRAATEDCDVRACLDRAIQALASEIEQVGATVEVHDPLPIVSHFPAELTAVFTQILTNAIRHKAERPLAIDVHATQRDGMLEIRIRDNGVGIPPKFHAMIFEPLARPRMSKGTPGSGLGLTFCRRVLESAGGSIDLDPREGEGSTFVVRLSLQ